jgi:hypothetical protein
LAVRERRKVVGETISRRLRLGLSLQKACRSMRVVG